MLKTGPPLKNATLFHTGARTDILIKNGRIGSIVPGLDTTQIETIGCRDKLLLPAFIDCHTHIDKAFPDTSQRARGLMDAVFITQDYQKSVPQGKIEAAKVSGCHARFMI